MTSIVKKTILAGLAALTMGAGVAATTTSAEAQVVYGRGYRGYHGGYGYRPAYYGPRYGYYGYRRYNGGAVAAGVVGGLALGALAAGAVAPAYAAPVYGDCWIERRQVADEWGNLYVRRVRVCN